LIVPQLQETHPNAEQHKVAEPEIVKALTSSGELGLTGVFNAEYARYCGIITMSAGPRGPFALCVAAERFYMRTRLPLLH